jgi:hypothetical protein
VPGVRVNSHDARDRTLDPGLLKGLADRRLGDRLPEIDSTAFSRVCRGASSVLVLSDALPALRTLTIGVEYGRALLSIL